MNYVKTIVDDRGKIEINVTLWVGQHYERDKNGNSFRYEALTMVTPKGKRKPVFPPDSAHVATDAEILAAKNELWNLIKPTP